MPSLMQSVVRRVGFHRALRLLAVYPPYLGAGIRVVHAASDATRVEVELRLTAWNRNYVGTQFGGSLYAMCDPFFMLMLMEQLGPGFVVWDRSAAIEFLRPGRGAVRARFDLPRERVDEIRRDAERSGKTLPRFEVTVHAADGTPVARVEKTLYVRAARAPAREPAPAAPG